MEALQMELDEVKARNALRSALLRESAADPAESLPGTMLKAMEACGRPVLLCLSDRDYVAREFEEAMAGRDAYLAMQRSRQLVLSRFDAADHTFSSADQRRGVERETLSFVRALLDLARVVECNQV